MIRSYSEFRRHTTFQERYAYLKLRGSVGMSTFGFDRYLNQDFYRSRLWRNARDYVISRDNGCDLGVPGYEIYDRVYVHHMNPIVVRDITESNVDILDPEFLITVTHNTHNAIHYGDERRLPQVPIERRPGDTTPWRS